MQRQFMDKSISNMEKYLIVHKKTDLFFNGFSDPQYQQGKNTLSKTNFVSIREGNRSDQEILNTTFNGHIIVRNEVHLMHNNIVYAGSEIAKTLSEFYDDLSYLPINDFAVERNFKRH